MFSCSYVKKLCYNLSQFYENISSLSFTFILIFISELLFVSQHTYYKSRTTSFS